MSKVPFKKMTYKEWCKKTGKPYGLTIMEEVGAWFNFEISPSSDDIIGWHAVDVYFAFTNNLTEEENIEVFWHRVAKNFITITKDTL